jgi:hypothetical protein
VALNSCDLYDSEQCVNRCPLVSGGEEGHEERLERRKIPIQ